MKAEQDQEQRIPLSELIDHVTMDGKLDPWAKEMVVKLLKPPQPIRAVSVVRDRDKLIYNHYCGACNGMVGYGDRYCRHCGCQISWGSITNAIKR